MHYFQYKGKKLYAEGVSMEKIAKEVGTPVYVYSHKTLTRHYNAFDNAFTNHKNIICYSVKANSNLSVLKTFADLGSGFDIVSIGELKRVLKAGASARRVVFSGVGKRADELEFALKKNILMFNVESVEELELLNKIAKKLKKKAPVAIRINPDVDPKTHPYISTGLKKNKFGIERKEALKQYLRKDLTHIDFIGVDCHIGSQLTQITPFIDALKRVKAFIAKLKKEGVAIKYLDLGGGLGITYDKEQPPHPSEYGEAILKETSDMKNVTLVFEPGRAMVGNAGIMLTQVVYTKKGGSKDFVIVDGAMNDLPRPSLYGSYHGIETVNKPANNKRHKVDVVGGICESGDFLAQDRKLPILKQGDLLSVMSAGAYGFTMASNYNTRGRAAEVMVAGNKFHVIRKREKVEDLFKDEKIITIKASTKKKTSKRK